jgi:hypothetical protein
VTRAALLLLVGLGACAGAPRGEGGGAGGPGDAPAPADTPDAPLGFAGSPREGKREEVERYLEEYGYEPLEFTPAPDRWRTGLPAWDRNPPSSAYDAPYRRGHLANPYRQNVLKGDYPILGQNTFLVLTATSDTTVEARKLPTPSAISTARPGEADFFGSGDQFFVTSNLALSFEVFRGNTAFKPPDFLVRVTPVLNANYLDVDENNAVNIDVREGTSRTDGHVGLQEAFVEKHIADLSANYDFLSVTAGIQPFVGDFRGLVFADSNLGARATFNLDSNRTQGSIAGFYLLEKDTNSDLNTLDARDQVVVACTLFRQDAIWPGYTLQGAFFYNHDEGTPHVDDNGVPVRPGIVGAAEPHDLDVFYMGFSGDGHIGRVNLTHEYFFAFGEDSLNPLAQREVDVEAHMAFVELSFDVDWWRPRASFLWASGDDDPGDGTAKGFDSILDNPNVAGGQGSFWVRQSLRLLGVNLVQRFSPYPSLRTAKAEGQANHVNPGLLLWTLGADAELTQEVRASLNVSYLRFSETGALEPFVNQPIDAEIGWEVSLAALYRPNLTNNVQLAGGLGVFFPGRGFADLYESRSTLYSLFFQLTLVY